MASRFSEDAQKAAKALTNLWETGQFVGKPHLLVVLKDGAGITFGKSQTTENSGGLWKLLFIAYPKFEGKFQADFEPYKEQLYKKGEDTDKKSVLDKKTGEYAGGLTNDEHFKDLLRKAATEDPAMNMAQDWHFHENFFKPALFICEDQEEGFNLSLPLSLAAIYDFCIHSGPGSKWGDGAAFNRLIKWNEDYEQPDDIENNIDAEKHWTIYMCSKRDAFLYDISHARKTRYRTGSMLKMMIDGNDDFWYLRTPLMIPFLKKDYIGYADTEKELTKAHLQQICITE